MNINWICRSSCHLSWVFQQRCGATPILTITWWSIQFPEDVAFPNHSENHHPCNVQPLRHVCISVHSYKNQKERWDLRWTYLQLNEVHLTISWVFSQPPSKTHISGGSTWCKSSRIRSWLRAPTASQPSWSKVTSTSPLGSESWKGSFFIATQQGTWLQYW